MARVIEANWHRYTDFLVNEILPSGQVVHLDDTQAPKDKKKKEAHGGPLEPAHTGSTAKGHQGESPKEDANMELAPDNGTDDVVMAGAPNVISDKSKGKPEPEFAPSQAKSRPTSMSQSSQPKDSASQPSDMEQPNIKDGEAQSINLHQPGSQAVPSTPLSMQGFNTPLQKSENLPPHMRIPAMSSAKIPLSMRDTDDTQTTSEPARKKNTVHMRQTSHGWIEVDEQMDKELKETKAAESAGETKSPKVSSQEGNMQEAGPENKTEPPVVQSTQASWQAFANKTSADAEASMGFQVSRSRGLYTSN